MSRKKIVLYNKKMIWCERIAELFKRCIMCAREGGPAWVISAAACRSAALASLCIAGALYSFDGRCGHIKGTDAAGCTRAYEGRFRVLLLHL
jgi:hypothetical protein